ncbi:hypothetical protein JZU46_02000 [bacterium]|jgi:hypothetical protein|nr:hypothetical protein [bacterium]
MNKKNILNPVIRYVDSKINSGYNNDGIFIVPIFSNRTHFFVFELIVTNDEYITYAFEDAGIIEELKYKEYPNILEFLCEHLDRFFKEINLENQNEYFESLTGRALRQARREHE